MRTAAMRMGVAAMTKLLVPRSMACLMWRGSPRLGCWARTCAAMRHAIMAMLRRQWFRQGRARKRMHQLVLMHAAGASVLRAVVKCKKATRRMVLTLLRERRKGSRETDPNTAACWRQDSRVHADDFTVHVKQGPAGVAFINSHISLNKIIIITMIYLAVAR